MTKEYIKKFSSHLADRGLRIKTSFRFHLITFRMAKSKKTKTINVVEGMEDKEHLHNVG